ncbi:Uncharacterized protein FKW44_015650, partial [Caligus rogercresseyi]
QCHSSASEGGKLHMLKEKWSCMEVPEKEAAALNLSNVGGVFVVLLGGLGVACIVAMSRYKESAPLLPGQLSTCTTNSTLNTLSRPQVTHLDLAAHAPCENGALSPLNEGFLTTSLS